MSEDKLLWVVQIREPDGAIKIVAHVDCEGRASVFTDSLNAAGVPAFYFGEEGAA